MEKKWQTRLAALCAVVLAALSVAIVLPKTEARAASAAEPSASQPSFSLPEPKKSGGTPVFDALASRASGVQSAFPSGKISAEELSTILWAASGLNRPGKGWTVPTAMGREPYCRVYVLGSDGAFLYDWKKHALTTISKGDLRTSVSGQSFVAGAPYILVFVADGKALGAFNTPRSAEWGAVLTGAMTQNVYLAAGAMDIGARYMASMKEDAVRNGLKLEKEDTPLCIMPLGKKK